LVERDVSRFNPGARPVMTGAKARIIDATTSPLENALRLLVKRWPSPVIAVPDVRRWIARTQGVEHADPAPHVMRRASEAAGMRSPSRKLSIVVDGPVGPQREQVRGYTLRDHDSLFDCDAMTLGDIARAGVEDAVAGRWNGGEVDIEWDDFDRTDEIVGNARRA
jgi:hypothetical protein